MNNVIGFFLSYAGVFCVIGIATLLLKAEVASYYVRKIVHIGVSNWWILAMVFFTDPYWPAAGALSFIIINYISYRRHVFRAMESGVPRENLGTVFFPVSLLVLSVICFGGYAPLQTGAAGILVLGYGDGMAAIAGKSFGRHQYRIFGSTRSFEGSAVMWAVSFAVVFVIASLYDPADVMMTALTAATGATLAEAVTPWGLDNLSVPLTASLLYFLCTGGIV